MSEIRAPDERVKVKKDLTGMRFGRWTVLERADDHVQPNGNRSATWRCRCDCGAERAVSHSGLLYGRSLSCGCLKAEKARATCQARKIPIAPGMKANAKHDLTGQRFGKLLVVQQAPDHVSSSGTRTTMWECVCDCGQRITCRTYSLTSGHTRSCGCLIYEESYRKACSERVMRHGDSRVGHKSRLYRVWYAMKGRCFCQTDSHYHLYGGRGITVCDEWSSSYEAFKDWALKNGYNPEAPHGDCTLDRIDVNGDYCPENCRWVTMKKQANNKQNSRLVEFDGKTQTVSEWAEESGIKPATLRQRLVESDWSIERALTQPVDPLNRRKFYEYNGITKSLSEWARDAGLDMKLLWARLKAGWDFEDAITRPIRKWPSQQQTKKE